MKTSSVAVLVICCAQGCSSVRRSTAYSVASVLDSRARVNFSIPPAWRVKGDNQELDLSASPSEQNCTFDDSKVEVVTTGLAYSTHHHSLMQLFTNYVLPVIEENLGPHAYHATHFDTGFDFSSAEVQRCAPPDCCVKKKNFDEEYLNLLKNREQPYVLFDLASIFLYRGPNVKEVALGSFHLSERINALHISLLTDWVPPVQRPGLLRPFEASFFRLFKLEPGATYVDTYVDRILDADWSKFPVSSTLTPVPGVCSCANVPPLPSKCWEEENNVKNFCFQMFHNGKPLLPDLVKAYACANDIDMGSETDATYAFNDLSAWLWRTT